jgi:uncharacterized protein (TIGR03000 family)
MEDLNMFSKYFLIPVILSFAGLLVTANAAHAQRGRGGRAGYQPAYRPAPAYHYSPYRSNYPAYVNRSLWVAPYYYVPNYSYYAPTYVAPTYSYYPPAYSYYQPSPDYSVQPAASTTAIANIRVVVPDPQATIFFDGRTTTSTGTERLFHTPALAFGGSYTYQIRATWVQGGRQVTQERTVSVMPGQTTVIDFTQPPSENIPPPSGD